MAPNKTVGVHRPPLDLGFIHGPDSVTCEAVSVRALVGFDGSSNDAAKTDVGDFIANAKGLASKFIVLGVGGSSACRAACRIVEVRRYQSFVATVEGGQRKIDVVELLAFAEAIGFDPREAIKRLSVVKPD